MGEEKRMECRMAEMGIICDLKKSRSICDFEIVVSVDNNENSAMKASCQLTCGVWFM